MTDSTLDVKLAAYKASPEAAKLVKSTPILILVGPTGAGKDALKDKLLTTGEYHHIVSHTTRSPRINQGIEEHDGTDYHFITKDQAESMLDNHEFIEAKMYSEHLYGTSVAEIKAAHDDGKIAMTDIEVQGVKEYKDLDPKVMAVFLLPPDFKTWQQRLQRRYGDVVDAEDHRLRLETALKELEQLLDTNYYIAIINDDLDKAYEHIRTIVQSKDHSTAYESLAREVAETLARDIRSYLNDKVK